MKTQAIVFTLHSEQAIKDLTARGNAAPRVTVRNYLGFSPSEAAQHVFVPKVTRNVYGGKDTEQAIPGSVDAILSLVDMREG